MTITQMVQNRQQQRIGELSQKTRASLMSIPTASLA